MILLRCTACAVAIILVTATQLIAADPLQAGIGVVDITPPIPFRMSGYFHERLSTGIKDRLQAKAVVFHHGGQWAALVFCDLIGISREVSTRCRREASDITGIPVDHIAIAATHSHTGPLYFGPLHHHFHERAVARHGADPYEKIDYPTVLVEKIVAAIDEAKSSLAAVQLESGNAHQQGLSFNRRFRMKDGTVRFNPGQLNPNIVRAAGPIDPQVGVLWMRRLDANKPLAAIVSFAMHLDTVSGTEYSADYPKSLEDDLQRSFGSEFTLLFGTGTCGDINHIDVTTRDVRSTAQIGSTLAKTVTQAVNSETLTVDKPALAVRSATVETPLQQYSTEEIAAARKNMELVGSRDLPFLEQVKACKIMDLQHRGVEKLPLEVQAFRLGRETAIVTLPGEIFVELGMAIKAASPFKTTLVIELTNDSPAYVPTKKAFVEGSYEIVNSRVQPGGGERLVEAAIGLLKELE